MLILAGFPGDLWGGGNPANARGWRAAVRPAAPERYLPPARSDGIPGRLGVVAPPGRGRPPEGAVGELLDLPVGPLLEPMVMTALRTLMAFADTAVELGKQSAANDSSCEWRPARLLSGHAACQRVLRVVIYMYWNERDHPVAHFHAYHAGRRASVSADGEVLAGSLEPRALQFVREWAVLRRGEILANWERARRNEPLLGIDPLA